MIIQSLLDTDLYKFSMMQVVLHHYPAAQVEYRFKCRNPGVDLVPYIDEIRAELDALCSLRFTPAELDYLRSWRYIKSDFVDFLGLFQLNAKYVSIAPAASGNGEIEIRIVGPWLHTILFEVPLLAIVNEVYFRNTQPDLDLAEGRRRLHAKVALLRGDAEYADCRIADYGTRHDSGDPFAWGEKVLAHYRANRVDPRSKILVFSDALDLPRVMRLYRHFRGRCQLAFGVGTNLTNDVGPVPLQIVIKMVRCNGQPVAKLSDSPGKNMCDDFAYVAYLRQVFEIPPEA